MLTRYANDFKARIEKLVFRVGGFLEKRLLEDIYEKWLWLQIKDGPFPEHIGIIPDGNRRWARRLGLDPIQGHETGYERIKEVLDWIWDLNVKYVTVYAMSSENCKYRSRDEFDHLLSLLRRGVRELLESGEIEKRRIRVKVIGDLSYLPQDLVDEVKKLEEKSSVFKDRTLTIAVCYGGRQEIIEAVRKLISDYEKGHVKISDVTEETFSKYLMTSDLPDPDLVIRTSGEVRISNFLLWQTAYSELYFCDVYWPEFRRIDFWRAIRSYQARERRFGR
uniref:Tritrans,polycis-undecaprenyl-diphosphate synthase (geranylgeranyl-diphosphate specific) n=1 Tax=Thermogladius calderae TaxID=1200300 RepID=A0A7J3XZG0_9CREN